MPLFTLERSEYRRDLNVLGNYVKDCALYLSRVENISLEEATRFIQENMRPTGAYPVQDPEVFYLAKEKPGNREAYTCKFSQYLQHTVDHHNLLAPTMAVYLNPNKKKSLIAKYIVGNMKKRKVFKKDMFVAKMEGDAPRESFYNNLQNTCKIKNNSVSGAHASPYTILYNKSSHSTLTSTCRSAASYGNANNEKFLMGNRHYWSPHVTMANVIAIVRHTNYELLQKAMDLYQIHYPSVEETMECIKYSSSLYWYNPYEMVKIEEFVAALKPAERAAFVYSGDLYHLAKYNDQLVRTFIDRMSTPAPHTNLTVPEAEKIVKSLSSDMIALVCLMCSDIMGGRLLDKVKEESPDGYCLVAETARQIDNVLNSYEPLIHGLWRTPVLPSSISALPSIIRRCVAVSDTDSTIFSTQHWTEWFVGKVDFSKKSYGVGYVMSFLASQQVIHLLAMMSANMGVVEEQIHQLTMKNEYYFPVFCLTSRAKHYFAYVSAQEGNVFRDMKMEIKGVELRSSNAPPFVMKRLEQYMKDVMSGIMSKGQLELAEVLGPVAEIEHAILTDIKTGGFKYMRTMQIKDSTSYVDGEEASPYMHFRMWEEVFAPKYGHTAPPPYQGVKLNVTLDSRRKYLDWLNSLEDKELAGRMQKFMDENKKDKITTFLFPLALLEVHGIPKEVIDVIETRKLIYSIMSPYYLVLETLGLYMSNDNFTRLVSDTYPPPAVLPAA